MQFDFAIVHTLNELTGTYLWFDNLVVFCAEILPWFTLVAFLIWLAHSTEVHRQRFRALFIAISALVIARLGVIESIRFFYERPRPFITHELNPLLTMTDWSFPSGHASVFSALAMTVFLFDRTWGVRFFIVTAIIVLARIISGVHYLTDVLAGLMLGSGAAWLLYTLVRKFAPFNRRRR